MILVVLIGEALPILVEVLLGLHPVGDVGVELLDVGSDFPIVAVDVDLFLSIMRRVVDLRYFYACSITQLEEENSGERFDIVQIRVVPDSDVVYEPRRLPFETR